MASTFPTALDAFTNPTATSLLTSPNHAEQHSDLNDAVEALEAKVAIGATVLGTYTGYTPTLTNLTLGNGTMTTSYCQVNNFVHFWGRIVVGTTTTFTGSAVRISLPINTDSTFGGSFGNTPGNVLCRDASAGSSFQGAGIMFGVTTAILETFLASGTFVSNVGVTQTQPMTWASTDILSWNFYYKAA